MIVLVLAAGTLFFTKFFNKPAVPESGTEEKMKDISILESLLGNKNTETASLVAVDESNSSGMAYRLLDNNKLDHIVMAKMPNPLEGNVYEGWLVQTDPLDFFSTGVMEKNEDDYWVLIYSGNQDMSDHLKVVITEETVIDDKPERHIIEGDF